MSSILIVPIRPVDHAELTSLIAPLTSAFEQSVSIEESSYVDPAFAFDSYRNQFNSTSIIAALLKSYPTHQGKIIGITTVDLFVPVFTYVFGEAQLDDKVAVLSSFRLREELFGLDPNPELKHIRLLKEAVHELGHTFGLIHCHRPECVMHSSTSAEEIDVKGKNFCAECEQTIREATSTMS
ncbi:MAG: archaemetzincin family Zn-dependent metalloprotease [Bacteroidota bacterium]